MNAIMVKETNGYYEIPGASTVEDWDDVQSVVDSVERLDSLKGWGEYTAVYRVTQHGETSTYFVAE